MARLPDLPPAQPIHLRPLLRERGHQQAALRLAAEEQLRRRAAHCEMEETRVREAVLPALRPDEGDKLQLDMYLSGSEGAAEGGAGYSVR